MFAALKSVFGFTMIQQGTPSVGRIADPDQPFTPIRRPSSGTPPLESPIGSKEFDMEMIFGDLPRLVSPAGVDDTDKIRARIVELFPEFSYTGDQTVNRRKLYMAIYRLRTESKCGWAYDQYVEKKDGVKGVLH